MAPTTTRADAYSNAHKDSSQTISPRCAGKTPPIAHSDGEMTTTTAAQGCAPGQIPGTHSETMTHICVPLGAASAHTPITRRGPGYVWRYAREPMTQPGSTPIPMILLVTTTPRLV